MLKTVYVIIAIIQTILVAPLVAFSAIIEALETELEIAHNKTVKHHHSHQK